jgi:hypothetical protein
MPRSAVLLAQDHTSDATYRAWVQGIEAGIVAMGWVRTSDTGQMNTATVLAPTGAFQTRGYIMWRATDALAATHPMLLRMEFASGANVNVPNYTIGFGSATNGAGVFTGPSWSVNPVGSPATASAISYRCLFSGDVNRIAVVLLDDHPTSSGVPVFSMERAHGTAGLANQFIPYVSTGSGVQSQLRGSGTSGSSAAVGLNIGLYPSTPIYGPALNPSVQWLSYATADIPVSTIFTLPFYGSTKTFVATQNTVGNEGRGRSALRWDL